MKVSIIDPSILVGQKPWQTYVPPDPTGPTAPVAPNAPVTEPGNGWPPPSDVDSGDLPD